MISLIRTAAVLLKRLSPKGPLCRFSSEKQTRPMATENQFSKIEIRVGRITQCQVNPNSEQLYVETIDIGGRSLSVGSKLAKVIPASEMTSKRILVVCNMKPRKLAGINSEGMLLAATKQGVTKLLTVPDAIKPGSRVYLQGQPPTNNIEQQLNPKKDILQRCLSNISTNNSGVAQFCGRRLLVGDGTEVLCELPQAAVS